MKIKAKDLSGAALDYAVARIEGALPGSFDDWKQTWPMYVTGEPGNYIIDRHGITVIRCDDDYEVDAKGYTTNKRIPVWAATIGQHSASERYGGQGDNYGEAYSIDAADVIYGRTRREAAMRAFVAWKHGRNQWDLDGNVEIDIPEELL